MPELIAEGFYDRVIVPFDDYLAKKHQKFDFILRDEIKKIIRLLFLPDHNSVIVTGPSGVGRKSLIYGLIQNRSADFMPSEIISRPFYRLNVNKLFDSGGNGHAENQLRESTDTLKKLYGRKGLKPILVIDDGASFVSNITKGNHQSLITILMNLDSVLNCLDLIITLDTNSARELKEAYPTFVSSFSELKIEPPTDEQLTQILKLESSHLADQKISVPDETLDVIKSITERYPKIFDCAQPKRSVRLLNESAIAYKLEMHSKPKGVTELEARVQQLEGGQALNQGETSLEDQKAVIDGLYATWKKSKSEIQALQDDIRGYENLITEKEDEVKSLEEENETRLRGIGETLKGELLEKAMAGDTTYTKGKTQADIELMDTSSVIDFLGVDRNMYVNPKISEIKKDIHRYESSISDLSDNVRLKAEELNYELSLPTDFVETLAGQLTKLPIGGVGGGMEKRLLNAREDLNNVVLGQEVMINPIVSALQTAAAGGNNPDKPLGTFLILGPSGVGKTFIAENIAEMLFESKDFLTVINMENYSKEHTVSSLIGAPPGYAGYGIPGLLIKTAQEKPYSVLLLDEIEKAHAEVLKVLLTALDKGYIKGLDGEIADLRNICIIATSNYGQDILLQDGMDFETARDQISHRIYRDPDYFAPEFLNRMSIIFANFLSEEVVAKIAHKEVQKLANRFKVKNPDFDISFSMESAKNLVKSRYKKANGARALQDLITEVVGGEASEIILQERQASGVVNGVLNVFFSSKNEFIFDLEIAEPA